jgi:murein peptide amidase A
VSPHNYAHLVSRWKSLARRAGLRLVPLPGSSEPPVFFLATPALGAEGGIYLSAGIHGDEPAGTEALLAWAEANVSQLREIPALLFPCLNPWGLVQNMRGDADGNDLNRCFHRRIPVIQAMKRVVGKRRFAAAIHLHEDFDGEGLYLYELARGEGWGEALLEAACPILPIDPRSRVDKWRAKNGLIRPRVRRAVLRRVGYPEAIWLFFAHTNRAFTIETPSEFALDRRVAAQVCMVNEIVRRACG